VAVGITHSSSTPGRLYEDDGQGGVLRRDGHSISPYLTLGSRGIVRNRDEPISDVNLMEFGNKPSDGATSYSSQISLIRYE
jgi:hypothetical protein